VLVVEKRQELVQREAS